MKRLNDEEFIFAPEEERTYTNNSIIAIRIKNGEYYFIGLHGRCRIPCICSSYKTIENAN